MEKGLKFEMGSRLRGFLGEKGLTQAEFSRAVGFTTGYVNDIIRGRTKPSINLLRRMRDVYGVTVDWVLTGETSHKEPFERPVIVGRQGGEQEKARYIAIPMLRSLETRILRGKSVVVKNLHPDYCCIVPRGWVKEPKDTFCTLVKDNSMEPTIPKGSHAGVNCTIREPSQLEGKLCAVRDGEGRLVVRRLRVTETHFLFEPDSPSAKGKTLCVEIGEENPIIGKVEWAWSFLK
jgi:transcriptional regulator with XRE-family HTH domain